MVLTYSIYIGFDTIYLAQVETIQTEQDRLRAVTALEALRVGTLTSGVYK